MITLSTGHEETRMKGRYRSSIAAMVGVGLIWVAFVVVASAGRQEQPGAPRENLQRQEGAQRRPVAVDSDDIGGVVTSAKGPRPVSG
jgi:hypothetical protein